MCVKAHNGGVWVGADVIVDFIGAPYWEQHMRSIAIDGRIQLTGMVRTYCFATPSVAPL